jgi:hypothetical protein
LRSRGATPAAPNHTSQDPCGWRTLDVLAEQLGSAEEIMMYGEAPVEEKPQFREMLARYGIA